MNELQPWPDGLEPPDYYKFPRELFEQGQELPDQQAAKLYFAALKTFFDGEVPDGLPTRANDTLKGWVGRIARARECCIARLLVKAKRGAKSMRVEFEKEGEHGDKS